MARYNQPAGEVDAKCHHLGVMNLKETQRKEDDHIMTPVKLNLTQFGSYYL